MSAIRALAQRRLAAVWFADLAELERIGPAQEKAAAQIRRAVSARGDEGYIETRRRFSEEMGGWDAYYDAAVLAGVGRRDEAFAELERGFREGNWYLIRTAVSPHMDPLRDDPRYADLVKRLGLDHVRPAPKPLGEGR